MVLALRYFDIANQIPINPYLNAQKTFRIPRIDWVNRFHASLTIPAGFDALTTLWSSYSNSDGDKALYGNEGKFFISRGLLIPNLELEIITIF